MHLYLLMVDGYCSFGQSKIMLFGPTPIELNLCKPQGRCIIRAHTNFSFWGANGPEKRQDEIRVGFWATKLGCFLTSPCHMTSGRVVELCRTFQDHTLDALGSSLAMRHDSSNIGMAMLFHCSHALYLTIKHFFPSFWGLTYLRYLVLLMIVGYGETDWPSA